MMTADKLRELAKLVGDNDLAKRARYEVADYLRACAGAAGCYLANRSTGDA